MESLFTSLKRLISGQPIFMVNSTSKSQMSDGVPGIAGEDNRPRDSYGTLLAPNGQKVMPVVIVNQIVSNHESGEGLECWVEVKNTSDVKVELVRATMLHEEQEIEHELAAGEERQCKIYTGPRPHSQDEAKCELTYKNGGGEYFTAEHIVEFEPWQDGTYIVKSMRFIPPVRTI